MGKLSERKPQRGLTSQGRVPTCGALFGAEQISGSHDAWSSAKVTHIHNNASSGGGDAEGVFKVKLDGKAGEAKDALHEVHASDSEEVRAELNPFHQWHSAVLFGFPTPSPAAAGNHA